MGYPGGRRKSTLARASLPGPGMRMAAELVLGALSKLLLAQVGATLLPKETAEGRLHSHCELCSVLQLVREWKRSNFLGSGSGM